MILSPHATASPSMMQERERSLATASTMSGKRHVRSLPGRLYQFHPLAGLASNLPEAIVLDFVQPERAGRRLRG
jgi:hypothetical protein